jgi:hypothetical protein
MLVGGSFVKVVLERFHKLVLESEQNNPWARSIRFTTGPAVRQAFPRFPLYHVCAGKIGLFLFTHKPGRVNFAKKWQNVGYQTNSPSMASVPRKGAKPPSLWATQMSRAYSWWLSRCRVVTLSDCIQDPTPVIGHPSAVIPAYRQAGVGRHPPIAIIGRFLSSSGRVLW